MERNEKAKKAVVSYRQRMKLRLIAYKGGQCHRCGYNKMIPSAYAFHHKNPEEKGFGIGGKSLKWSTMKKEADKCFLLCSNCHAEIHDEERKSQRLQNIDSYNAYLESFLKEIECKQCGEKFIPNNSKRQYCSKKCSESSQERNERPSVEQLAKMISEKSWCAIGRDYGVSDNAIREWAKKYGIYKSKTMNPNPVE